MERGEEQGVTSTLVLSQVATHLTRHGKGEVIKPFIDYFYETGILVLETTFLDFMEAIAEMNKLNLDSSMWDDIILSCQMRKAEIQEIYTNDKDFEKINWVKPIFPH